MRNKQKIQTVYKCITAGINGGMIIQMRYTSIIDYNSILRMKYMLLYVTTQINSWRIILRKVNTKR